MGDASSPEPAWEAVADATSTRAADAFAVLSSESRLTILLALWEAHEPFTEDNTLSFTALRERVGIKDSGQFNYHLDKLSGHFVEATDEGYTLRTAGHKIIRAVVAGVGLEDPTLETTDVDVPCPHCGASTAISYEDRKLQITCSECVAAADSEDAEAEVSLTETDFDPAGLAGRTPAETILANGFQETQKNAMRLSGVCPDCSGVVDSWFDICDDHEVEKGRTCPHCNRHERIRARFVCTVCKDAMQTPAGSAAGAHPAGQAFLGDHGYPWGLDATESADLDEILELREAFDYEHELRSEQPLRVEIRLSHESGDEIRFVFNESVEVVEITRSG